MEPTRVIVQAEALGWLSENKADADVSVITSLPDISEISELDFHAWRAWFISAARAVIEWTPPQGITIFYQSDVRHGSAWIDKGYLVSRAAEDAKATLLWHKIVCRKPPGSLGHGRATYSHMLAFTRTLKEIPKTAPDVLPSAGLMPWSKAMGVAACVAACSFLRDETSTRTIVDPFCGGGTALAVGNAMGFDALGIDRSARRCRLARKLRVTL
jgi:hypothetical protein